MTADQKKAEIEKLKAPLAKVLEGVTDPGVGQSLRNALAHLDEAVRAVPADAPPEEPKVEEPGSPHPVQPPPTPTVTPAS